MPEQKLQALLDACFPSPEADGLRTHLCYFTVCKPREEVHTDLTGRFPIPSQTGMQYLFVLCHYDSNAILLEPVRNRKAETLLAAYEKIHKRLTKAGCRPKLQRLDNKASKILTDFMEEKDVKYQFVPPHDHRRNAAE